MNMEGLDKEAFIQMMTEEIYKRLQQRQAAQTTPTVKQQAILLSAEPMPELANILNEHYDVQYYDESIRDCELIVVPKICIQLLANLANGISAGHRERFLLTMLLKGKKVVVLEEGLVFKKYKSTAPVMLYKQYEGYVDKLRSFGIRLVSTMDLLLACLDKEEAADVHVESTPAAAGLEVLSQKVITEAEMKKYHFRNIREIVVNRNSIITPLAQDYIRMQQMHVHRR
ncbi:ethanolamine utilization protein [Paenibacillus selenitireducens]|uniref:Ethanolamine utilization protein n=1 Tax=Paenibacillus selenitireducens TaxID=1324314 RepID=A0A1T2X614_9BACL|nr:ethanolamine utilization protein [Paenibacillus selenitireducens]OPA75331.1 ethanolamine utilization protein [Paenibacillus selenitireducens]